MEHEPTPPMTEEQLRAVVVGELKKHDAPVTIVDYDPKWPRLTMSPAWTNTFEVWA